MSNLLDERDKRTKKRKKAKKEIDALINLSVNDKKTLEKVILSPKDSKSLGAEDSLVTHRLLDEGSILYADGEIDCIIAKGTLEKYLNGENTEIKDSDGNIRNLTDDYVGTINYGHHDLATDPIALIGEWKKEDLHLVDIENGRKALDVDVRLNDDHIYVKQLRNLDYEVGLSAEFWCHYDEKKSEEIGYPVIDEIFLSDFAVVGECGNVNSSDLRLKGGLEMPKDIKELEVEETKDDVAEVIDDISEENAEISEETEVVEETIEETEKDAEIEEQATEECEETEQVEDTEATEDEVEGDEVEEDEETEDEDEDVVSELIETVKELKKENASLKEENASLKKSNNRLNKKLKARNEEAKKFIADFKGLSVEMGITKDEPKQELGISREYLVGDGIGE